MAEVARLLDTDRYHDLPDCVLIEASFIKADKHGGGSSQLVHLALTPDKLLIVEDRRSVLDREDDMSALELRRMLPLEYIVILLQSHIEKKMEVIYGNGLRELFTLHEPKNPDVVWGEWTDHIDLFASRHNWHRGRPSLDSINREIYAQVAHAERADNPGPRPGHITNLQGFARRLSLGVGHLVDVLKSGEQEEEHEHSHAPPLRRATMEPLSTGMDGLAAFRKRHDIHPHHEEEFYDIDLGNGFDRRRSSLHPMREQHEEDSGPDLSFLASTRRRLSLIPQAILGHGVGNSDMEEKDNLQKSTKRSSGRYPGGYDNYVAWLDSKPGEKGSASEFDQDIDQEGSLKSFYESAKRRLSTSPIRGLWRSESDLSTVASADIGTHTNSVDDSESLCSPVRSFYESAKHWLSSSPTRGLWRSESDVSTLTGRGESEQGSPLRSFFESAKRRFNLSPTIELRGPESHTGASPLDEQRNVTLLNLRPEETESGGEWESEREQEYRKAADFKSGKYHLRAHQASDSEWESQGEEEGPNSKSRKRSVSQAKEYRIAESDADSSIHEEPKWIYNFESYVKWLNSRPGLKELEKEQKSPLRAFIQSAKRCFSRNAKKRISNSDLDFRSSRSNREVGHPERERSLKSAPISIFESAKQHLRNIPNKLLGRPGRENGIIAQNDYILQNNPIVQEMDEMLDYREQYLRQHPHLLKKTFYLRGAEGSQKGATPLSKHNKSVSLTGINTLVGDRHYFCNQVMQEAPGIEREELCKNWSLPSHLTGDTKRALAEVKFLVQSPTSRWSSDQSSTQPDLCGHCHGIKSPGGLCVQVASWAGLAVRRSAYKWSDNNDEFAALPYKTNDLNSTSNHNNHSAKEASASESRKPSSGSRIPAVNSIVELHKASRQQTLDANCRQKTGTKILSRADPFSSSERNNNASQRHLMGLTKTMPRKQYALTGTPGKRITATPSLTGWKNLDQRRQRSMGAENNHHGNGYHDNGYHDNSSQGSKKHQNGTAGQVVHTIETENGESGRCDSKYTDEPQICPLSDFPYSNGSNGVLRERTREDNERSSRVLSKKLGLCLCLQRQKSTETLVVNGGTNTNPTPGRSIAKTMDYLSGVTFEKCNYWRNGRRKKAFQAMHDIDTETLAKEMTLIDKEMLVGINHTELEDTAWTKKDKNIRSPNIMAMIEFFERIASLVATEILHQETPKDRAEVMCHFIAVADRCQKLSNFSSLRALLGGLQMTPIFRLEQTWDYMRARCKSKHRLYIELDELMSFEHNHSRYRKALSVSLTKPPCLPFIGIFLQTVMGVDTVREVTGRKKKKKPPPTKKPHRRPSAYQFRRHSLFQLDDSSDEEGEKDIPVMHIKPKDMLFQYQLAAIQYTFDSNVTVRDFLLRADYNSDEENYKLSLQREPSARSIAGSSPT